MVEDKFTYIAKLEKAIKEKYGEEALIVPKLPEEREQEYLDQIKLISFQEIKNKEQISEKEGFLIEKKLIIKDIVKECPKCNVLTKYIIDDLYILKFKMCYKCFLINEEKFKK